MGSEWEISLPIEIIPNLYAPRTGEGDVELRSKIEGIMRLRESKMKRITDEHFKKGSVRRV